MNAAGSKGNSLANKYRDKGLRVIAIDVDGRSLDQSLEKWRAAGADFYLYDMDMNCLQPFYKNVPGFPYNIAIKEWKGREISDNEASIKAEFGF